jgi:hypothetical protein
MEAARSNSRFEQIVIEQSSIPAPIFAHPCYNSGLGIAVRPTGSGGWVEALRHCISSDFFRVIVVLAVLISIPEVLPSPS